MTPKFPIAEPDDEADDYAEARRYAEEQMADAEPDADEFAYDNLRIYTRD